MGKYCRQHIGKTFNDGKLTVVDGGDKHSHVKVKCRICAEDSELFGDGVFESRLSGLEKRQLPCGCSKKHIWSLDQYKIRILRRIDSENLPIIFIGFGTPSKPLIRTELKLYCNKECEEYSLKTISSFFQGNGNNGKIYTTDESILKYNQVNLNSVVWNSGKKSGGNFIFGFYCSICEANGYESVFEIKSNHLLAGAVPCYCSKKWSINGDYIVQKSKEKLYEAGLNNLSVVGAYYKSGYWYSVFMCEVHGVYSRIYGGLNKYGCHCVKCTPAISGYSVNKKGFLYLLQIRASSYVVFGYGITNVLSKRIKTHELNLSRIGATITNIQVFEGSGTAVLAAENAIKASHPTGLLDCEGFRRESISIDRKEEVLELCKKLKVLDNVDKLI